MMGFSSFTQKRVCKTSGSTITNYSRVGTIKVTIEETLGSNTNLFVFPSTNVSPMVLLVVP
jgi:hypothetical protein